MNPAGNTSMQTMEYNKTHDWIRGGQAGCAIRDLIAREWTLHGRRIEWSLSIWLIGVWILPMAWHPLAIVIFGSLYACSLGVGVGGEDLSDECEEFVLSLPPTRTERYIARFLFGGVPLLGMTLFGSVAIAGDLPQRLWGLIVESGLTEPFPAVQTAWWYVAAVSIPLWIYCLNFAAASLARSQKGVLRVIMLDVGLVYVAGLVVAVCNIFDLSFAEIMWGPSVFTLLTAPVLALDGLHFYRIKESGWNEEREARARFWHDGRHRSVWRMIVLVIVVLFVAFILLRLAAIL